MSWNHEKD
jgi:hypothetical protein